MNNICFNKTMFIILMVTIVISGVFLTFRMNKKDDVEIINLTRDSLQNQPDAVGRKITTITQKPDIDPIYSTDYKRMTDVLEEPTRRLPRHALPPNYLASQYTRGFPDNYTLLGVLVKKIAKGDNVHLPLYGRQTYPTSRQWEYYTSTVNLGVNLKIPIEINKDELFTDDTIRLKDFGNDEYRVNLYKIDRPVYNPFVLY